MTSVLAGKKFTPPFKGQAEVDFTKPVTKNEKGDGHHHDHGEEHRPRRRSPG